MGIRSAYCMGYYLYGCRSLYSGISLVIEDVVVIPVCKGYFIRVPVYMCMLLY